VVYHPETGCFERLKQRACRRFADVTFGEEAFDFAIERLSRSDWAKLSQFRGDSLPETYLTTVFNNLVGDFARRRLGSVRPPAWLRALGNSAVRVFLLLCKKRLEPETIVDWMCARGAHREEWVREHIQMIKARVPDCGRHVGPVTLAEIPEDHVEEDGTDPEAMMEHERRDALKLALGTLLDGDVDDLDPELRQALAMSDDDRLLLKLVYMEGNKVAAAARALKMAEHTVRRRLKSLLTQIADGLGPLGPASDPPPGPGGR
jgi:RNA polymerase sigma factor (sigma-70 family)